MPLVRCRRHLFDVLPLPSSLSTTLGLLECLDVAALEQGGLADRRHNLSVFYRHHQEELVMYQKEEAGNVSLQTRMTMKEVQGKLRKAEGHRRNATALREVAQEGDDAA